MSSISEGHLPKDGEAAVGTAFVIKLRRRLSDNDAWEDRYLPCIFVPDGFWLALSRHSPQSTHGREVEVGLGGECAHF